jgi:hypothetical protein
MNKITEKTNLDMDTVMENRRRERVMYNEEDEILTFCNIAFTAGTRLLTLSSASNG